MTFVRLRLKKPNQQPTMHNINSVTLISQFESNFNIKKLSGGIINEF
jgi:hypothetical protein